MIKTLDERIAKCKKEFERRVEREKRLEEILFKVPELYNVDAVSHSDIFLVVKIATFLDNLESLEFILLELIPAISDCGFKWEEEVFDYCFVYETGIYHGIYFRIIVYATDQCVLEKVPTGRVVKKRKEIEVEEDEYEVVVRCPGE